jgi:hypothetical protein
MINDIKTGTKHKVESVEFSSDVFPTEFEEHHWHYIGTF